MPNDTGTGPNVDDAIISKSADQIIIATYTILTACGLALAYAITVTKFRLWHSNPILEKIPQLVNNPIAHALSVGVSLIAVVPLRNDLYIIWLVILAIIFDNVQAITNFSLLEKGANRLSREYVFLYNCVIIGSVIIVSDRKSIFFRPLIALWSLLILKFIERLICYKFADRAYGIKNTNLVADYMMIEHTLSKQEACDPKSMKGYKYLVIGEEKAQFEIQPPSYTFDFTKSENEFVTLETVWGCNRRLVHRNIDKDDRIKDICLSFALFKLIRRRFFGFHASESKEPKTKKFIFQGLLSRKTENGEMKTEDVFRVIRLEMGFLRDFFYTRYPVIFALGFPVFNIIILIVMCLLSISISALASHRSKYHSKEMDYLTVNNTNVDYRITNGLLIMIILTEILEVLSYVFSDWMRVIMICRHVRSEVEEPIPVVDTMLSLLFKLRFNVSIKNKIGQYSLLKSYNKGNCKRVTRNCVYYSTIAMVGTKMVRGMKADTAIYIPEEVKTAIHQALIRNKGELTDIWSPLTRNGVAKEVVEWLDHSLKTNPILTIMVLHIATSLCEKCPLKQPIINNMNCSATCFTKCMPSCPPKRKITGERLVASSLSKYCAYLVVFVPELLPTTTYSAKHTFDRIVSETKEFFKDANGPNALYDEMVKVEEKAKIENEKIKARMEADKKVKAEEKAKKRNEAMNTRVEAEEKCNETDDLEAQEEIPLKKEDEIIYIGAKLGQYLTTLNDVERWKMMAEVWSEFILYLALKGDVNGYLKSLAGGGEFITHLWILLYHAGIVDSDFEEFEPAKVKPPIVTISSPSQVTI